MSLRHELEEFIVAVELGVLNQAARELARSLCGKVARIAFEERFTITPVVDAHGRRGQKFEKRQPQTVEQVMRELRLTDAWRVLNVIAERGAIPPRAGDRLRAVLSYCGPAPSGRVAEELPHTGKETKALAILIEHPGWTDQRIAAAAGCCRQSLYRMKQFVAARRMLKEAKHNMPRGAKGSDLEAWDSD